MKLASRFGDLSKHGERVSVTRAPSSTPKSTSDTFKYTNKCQKYIKIDRYSQNLTANMVDVELLYLVT